MFVDADDTVSNTICEDLLKAVKENSADMSFCNLVNYSPSGEERFLPFTGDNRIFENAEKKRLEYYLVSKQSETGDILLCLSGPVCKLISRNKIKKVKFPEDINLGEDTCFVLDIIDKVERIIYINKFLYNRFSVENSLSSLNWKYGERIIKYNNWVINKYYKSDYFRSGVINLTLLNLTDTLMVYYIYLSGNSISDYKKSRMYLKNYGISLGVKIKIKDIIKANLSFMRKIVLLLDYFKFNYLLFLILRIAKREKN